VITQFRDMWRGETVFVFGSGKSLDYFNPRFFDGKPCVATNRAGFEYGLSNYYTVTHHFEAGEVYPKLGISGPIITPDRDTTNLESNVHGDRGNVFRYRASRQRFDHFSVEHHWPRDHDTLVVGSTGLHSAMHFAQFAGASTIILVGADTGRLDGETNFANYLRNAKETEQSWVAWEKHNREVANKLRSLGCAVYSLSPFINFGLESHKFEGGA